MATTTKTREKEKLDYSIEATLEVLQKNVAPMTNIDIRAYCAMGAVQSLLEALAKSPRLTKAQREQVLMVGCIWDEAVFGKKEPDVLGKVTNSESCPTDEKEEV